MAAPRIRQPWQRRPSLKRTIPGCLICTVGLQLDCGHRRRCGAYPERPESPGSLTARQPTHRPHGGSGAPASFQDHPDLEPGKPGDWSDYDRTPTVRVRRGHAFSSERLDLGYLRDVHLPASTRFVGGFVHEERTLTEQRALLLELDRLIGRPVDVACSCGLGRRDTEAALAVIDRTAELCGVGWRSHHARPMSSPKVRSRSTTRPRRSNGATPMPGSPDLPVSIRARARSSRGPERRRRRFFGQTQPGADIALDSADVSIRAQRGTSSDHRLMSALHRNSAEPRPGRRDHPRLDICRPGGH